MRIANMSLFEVFRASLPFIVLMLIALVLLTYVPWFSMVLPDMLFQVFCILKKSRVLIARDFFTS